MQDEAGGFLSRPLKLGTFSMMCHALISAGNLRRGLLRGARYIALVTDDVTISLEESGDEAHVVFDIANTLQTDEAFFTTSMFIIWIRLFCWLIDQPMLLDRVRFTFAEPDYSDEFSLIFPCRHDFAQPRNVVTFNRRILSNPIRQDATSLVDFLHQAPQSLLTQFRDDDSVTAQIKRLLLRRNGGIGRIMRILSLVSIHRTAVTGTLSHLTQPNSPQNHPRRTSFQPREARFSYSTQ